MYIFVVSSITCVLFLVFWLCKGLGVEICLSYCWLFYGFVWSFNFCCFWFYKSDLESFGFVPLELNALLTAQIFFEIEIHEGVYQIFEYLLNVIFCFL